MEHDKEHICDEGIQGVQVICKVVSGDEYWYFEGYEIKYCPFCGVELNCIVMEE